MNACASFRAEVERALAGPAGALARLASDEHVRSCVPCRAELARERALDGLLSRPPAPEVPPALARRVLARLAGERARATPEVTAEDGVLDEALARVPAPRVPDGLAGRVLAGVAHARAAQTVRAGRRPWWLLAAAGLLVGLTFFGWREFRPASRGAELVPGTGSELEADDELLAYAVERWELLQDDDLDVWLASLDPVDELLIEYVDPETWVDDGSREGGAEGD